MLNVAKLLCSAGHCGVAENVSNILCSCQDNSLQTLPPLLRLTVLRFQTRLRHIYIEQFLLLHPPNAAYAFVNTQRFAFSVM